MVKPMEDSLDNMFRVYKPGEVDVAIPTVVHASRAEHDLPSLCQKCQASFL